MKNTDWRVLKLPIWFRNIFAKLLNLSRSSLYQNYDKLAKRNRYDANPYYSAR